MPLSHRIRGLAYARVAVVALPMLLASCAARPQSPSGEADPAAEARAVQSTQLRAPLRLIFAWSLQDRDARFAGEGVTRLEPPYRARLDLFGPRGEGYLSAALVDFDLRLPPGTTSEVLPPPALFWTVLGVFRAPQSARLVSTRGDSTTSELVYRAGNQTWTFSLVNGRLQRAEWQGPEQGRQTVEIKEFGERDLPARVVYRDWRAFRELSLTLTRVYDAESFPPEIWTPGAR